MTKQEIIYDEINYNIIQYNEYYNNELIITKIYDQYETVSLTVNFKNNNLVRIVMFDAQATLHKMKTYTTFVYTIATTENGFFRIIVNDKFNIINLNKVILNLNGPEGYNCTQLCTLNDYDLVTKINEMLNINENIFRQNSYTLSKDNDMSHVLKNFNPPENTNNFINYFNDF